MNTDETGPSLEQRVECLEKVVVHLLKENLWMARQELYLFKKKTGYYGPDTMTQSEKCKAIIDEAIERMNNTQPK